MTDTALPHPETTENRTFDAGQARAPDPSSREEAMDFGKFLVGLAIIVFVLRSFLLSPFNIPSESMQPRLLIGDYLLVNKLAYGYTRHSLPFSMPLIPGRVLAKTPARGDVVVFKAPPSQRDDYIKRVIGVAGDTVEVRAGRVILNGQMLPRKRVEDFVIPVTQNMIDAARAGGTLPCFLPEFEELAADGTRQCRYPQFAETLPGGPTIRILDIIVQDKDDFAAITVPPGQLFLMGDNRDRSADSRFDAEEGLGIGLVPEENLVGKALVGMFSTDGSASWINPLSWFSAARWDRIGDRF